METSTNLKRKKDSESNGPAKKQKTDSDGRLCASVNALT